MTFLSPARPQSAMMNNAAPTAEAGLVLALPKGRILKVPFHFWRKRELSRTQIVWVVIAGICVFRRMIRGWTLFVSVPSMSRPSWPLAARISAYAAQMC